ncbi:MAG TPA: hypothetical protein VHR66_23825 [Gemmataceae bacterium]|jgi:hypothetical protein|nr:hypothetical protein [Gemmataceae bacterium]
MPTKAERIVEFFRRLAIAEPAATLEEAFRLVCETLNGVEDEWTDIPFNQETSDTDGRLYPPLWENLRSVPDHPDVKRHRHRWHNTFFAPNGAIEIVEVRSGAIVFSKPGLDGKGVWS